MAIRLLKAQADLGLTIVTNTPLEGIPYKDFDINTIDKAMKTRTDLRQVYQAKKGICMFLDEITTIADSRQAMTYGNILLSYMFMQARKRRMHIIGTLQLFSDLDKRPRRLVNVKVLCRRVGSIKEPEAFIYKYVNRLNGRIWYRVWKAEDAQRYYRYYDTEAAIYPQVVKRS